MGGSFSTGELVMAWSVCRLSQDTSRVFDDVVLSTGGSVLDLWWTTSLEGSSGASDGIGGDVGGEMLGSGNGVLLTVRRSLSNTTGARVVEMSSIGR